MPNPIVVERRYVDKDGKSRLRHCYWCPGCDSLHCIGINPDKQDNGAGWDFSGTLECPTYAPSQLSRFTQWTGEPGGKPFVCHTFIRNGHIEFLSDCTHSLKGTTVPLPPLPDWMVKESESDS